MKIALVQIDTIIADFIGNRERILEKTLEARAQGAELVVFPELVVCGYPPLDLLTYPAFIRKNKETITWLGENIPDDIAIAVGFVDENTSGKGKSFYNDLAVIYQKKIIHKQAKTLLPTYDVFDEDRYFEPAEKRIVLSFKGYKIGFAICEDIWAENVGDSNLI